MLIGRVPLADAVTSGGGDAVHLAGLVIAACVAAPALAALAQHLGAFDARRDRLAGASPAWRDALGWCALGCALCIHRLLQPLAAWSSWQAGAAAAEGTEALPELARDLAEEGRRQEAAASEVAELLR